MANVVSAESTPEDVVPKVPIHNAPKDSPRKRRRQNAKAGPPPQLAPVEGKKLDHPTTRRAHAMDFAPVHSKLVKTSEGAVMVTPADTGKYLPKGDIAHGLPTGAKIEKIAAESYRSSQLDAQFDIPPTLHTTAIEAIEMFAAHFWPS